MDKESIIVNSIICEDVRRESNGTAMLLGVYFDAILFDEIPEKDGKDYVLDRLAFFNLVEGITGKHKLKWWFEAPGGAELSVENSIKELDVNFHNERTHAIILRLQPANFPVMGEYKFAFQIEDFVYEKRILVQTADLSKL